MMYTTKMSLDLQKKLTEQNKRKQHKQKPTKKNIETSTYFFYVYFFVIVIWTMKQQKCIWG